MRRRVVGIGRITVPAIGIETNIIPLHICPRAEAVCIIDRQHRCSSIGGNGIGQMEVIVLKVAYLVDGDIFRVDRERVAVDGRAAACNDGIPRIARAPDICLRKVRRIDSIGRAEDNLIAVGHGARRCRTACHVGGGKIAARDGDRIARRCARCTLSAINILSRRKDAAVNGHCVSRHCAGARGLPAKYRVRKGKCHAVDLDRVPRHRRPCSAVTAHNIPVDDRCIRRCRRRLTNRKFVAARIPRNCRCVNPRCVRGIRRRNVHGICVCRRCIEHQSASCGQPECHI